jgi:hypothetical protein
VALTIDGSGATAIATAVTSVSAAITTTNANDIILAFVHAGALGTGGAATVTSVTAAGLTFTRRASDYRGSTAPWNTVELWWAPATAALTAKSVTATLSRTIDDCSIQLVAVSGCGSMSNPFDVNGSLPAVTGNISTGSTAQTVSTSTAVTMLLAFFGSFNGTNETLGSGWTTLLSTANGGGGNFSETFSQYRTFSSAQTSFAGAFGAANRSGFGVIYDALTASSTISAAQAVSMTTTSAVAAAKSAGKPLAGGAGSALTLIRRAGKIPNWTTASTLTMPRAVGKLPSWVTASTVSLPKAPTRALDWTTASTLTALKQMTQPVAFVTASTVSAAAVLAHLVTLAFATASAVSVTAGAAFARAVSLTTASSLALTRQAGKLLSWTAGGALSTLRERGRLIAFTTASTLTFAKAAARTFRFVTASSISALLFGRLRSQAIAFTTVSAVSLRRTVGKLATWTTAGAAALVASGGRTLEQLVEWTTASTLAARKQAGKALSLSSTHALQMARRVGKPLRWTTTSVSAVLPSKLILKAIAFAGRSTVALVKQARRTLKWATSSSIGPTQGNKFVGASKAKLAAIAIRTTSAISLSLSAGKRVAIASLSTLRARKDAAHTLLWTTTSTLRAGVIKAQEQVVLIVTDGAVSVVNTVTQALAWVTGGVGSLANAVGKALNVASGSALVPYLLAAKTVAWTTAGALSTLHVLQRNVDVLIATVSTLIVRAAPIRAVLVGIASQSGVLLAFAATQLTKPVITLFGAAARVLLYGFRTVLTLTGEVVKLELMGMATRQDGVFHAGESWVINGVARDETGAALDLTGGVVQLRLTTANPNAVALDLATPSNGSIVNGPKGLYAFTITPTQQSGLTATDYAYEARATLNDGSVFVLNVGELEIRPSKFVNFP